MNSPDSPSLVCFILRGLPGSGKSTLAKLLSDLSPLFTICSADDYFIDEEGNYKFDPTKLPVAHAVCKSRAFCALESHVPVVIIDNTNVKLSDVRAYKSFAEDYGYTVIQLIVENTHGNQSIHGVPEQTMKSMQAKFEIKL